jgi:xylulokinase
VIGAPGAATTALGAALLGGIAAGLYPDMESAVSGLMRRDRLVEPDAETVARYDALRSGVFERAGRDLKPVEAGLARWRGE